MKRKYIKARCNQKGLKLRLWFDPKNDCWEMMGGIYGPHKIYNQGVFNDKVKTHWEGYIVNNGLKFDHKCWVVYREV